MRAIDRLYEDAQIQQYIDHAWGSADHCRMAILSDFFRSAFDGSGADNFFDAGSCIDGRLTSAWHWCSQIQKKPFYPIFLLAGFTSFDGEFYPNRALHNSAAAHTTLPCSSLLLRAFSYSVKSLRLKAVRAAKNESLSY